MAGTRGWVRRPLTVRELADAEGGALARRLTPAQRERYAGTPNRRGAASVIASERLAVRSRPEGDRADVGAEGDEVTGLHAALGRASQWPRRLRQVTWGATIVCGWVFLVAGVLAMFGMTTAFVISAAAMALASLFLVVSQLLAVADERAQIGPALEWASGRPGQLGRGVPGLRLKRSSASALWLVVFCTQVILIGCVVGGVGIAVLVGGLELVFWAMGTPPKDLDFVGQLLLVTLIPLVVSLLLGFTHGWLVRRDELLASSLEWMPRGGPPRDEAPRQRRRRQAGRPSHGDG